MLKYRKNWKDVYEVMFGDLQIGIIHLHLAVLAGDKNYWVFSKAVGKGRALELRAPSMNDLKLLVEHYVSRKIELGMCLED